MSRKLVIILGIVALAAVSVAALTVFREPEAASAPIEAVPLVVETVAPVAIAEAATEPTATTEAVPLVEPADEPTAEATAEAAVAQELPTEEPVAAELVEEPVSTTGPVVFEIVSAESQARFVINEVLRGSPKTVVGATDQVSGQLSVDPADPGTAQVGTILVNARTLATDSSSRDRALKNWILQTNTHEYVTFEPAEIVNMPDNVTVGAAFSFQLTGNLTVRDTTIPVTFDVTVTPVSDTRLEGLATLTIPYRDLNVSIPDSPSVDTVADELTLELEFVAAAVSGV